MKEAEGIDFKVGIPKNQEGKNSRRMNSSRGPKYDNPTLADIILFIGTLAVSEESKKTLVSIARKAPNGSLANFRANYTRYLKNSR